jgi:hypothetical protein
MLQMKVLHFFPQIEEDNHGINAKLDAIIKLLGESRQREITMSVEMDALQAAVTQNTSLDDSIIVLLNGLAAQVLDAAGDKAKATALAAELTAKSTALQAAITANTPAA